MKISLQLAPAAAALLLSAMAAAASAQTQHLTVQCSAGQTIARALSAGDIRRPLVITVNGTCNEFVVISRDDVTLEGDSISGGTVSAPNATGAAIWVRASRVTIDRLHVIGGRDGIFLDGTPYALVSNSAIQETANVGLRVMGGHARILGCTVQKAGSHGVFVQNASVQINNSQIVDNGDSGIYVQMNSGLNAYGNTIQSNGGSGVWMYMGSSGFLNSNTISNNGTDPNSNFEQNGILVNESRANLTLNTITNNPGNGVKGVAAAGVDMFNNTVTNNSGGGVGTLGTSLGMSWDKVSYNQGYGVSFGAHSTGTILGATIENNAGNGIFLEQASKLILSQPTSVAGNSPWRLECIGQKTSVNDTSLLNRNVSPNCTGF